MRVQPLPQDASTLAELARHAGLETAAICGNVAYLYSIFGLDQGFDTYVDTPGNGSGWTPVGFRLAEQLGAWRFWPYWRTVTRNNQLDRLAGEVNRLALEWLAPRRDRRFFLFLNYVDPHEAYLPLWRYARRFPASSKPVRLDRDAVLSGRRQILPEERASKVDAYDAEIRYVDDRLSELVRQIEDWGLLDKTLVVIVGDHGESFGEHQDLGHGNNVYETEVRAPLIVRRPGQTASDRIARRVHHVDVMPTVLDALAIPRPPDLQGTGLFEEARRMPVVAFSGSKPGLAERYPRYGRGHDALYRDRWKAVIHSDGTMELYDLERDPDEAVDLAEEQPGALAGLAGEIRFFKASVKPMYPTRVESLAEETRRRLKALGYLD